MNPTDARYFLALFAAYSGDRPLRDEVLAACSPEERINACEMLDGGEVDRVEQGLAAVLNTLREAAGLPRKE